MKYFTVDKTDFTIVEIFDKLKDIRTAYDKIDVIDYVDDLDKDFENKYFVSENYFSDFLKKTKEGDEDSSLRDLISLKEELDAKTEEYLQAQQEIELVHKEIVSQTKEKDKTAEELAETSKTLDMKLTELNSQEQLRKSLEAKLQLEIKDNLEREARIKKILSSNKQPHIQEQLDLFSEDLNELSKELEKFRGGTV